MVSNNHWYTLWVSLFVGCITISSILANKIITIMGVFVPAGVIAYSITFIATDVISEVWGKERAQETVFGGFIALIAVFVLIQISLMWPKASFWNNDDAFASILGSTSRIIIASFIAYLVSQMHDVWAFHFWKRVTNSRHLWLRNNLSTAVSQFLDSFIFITIAFYGVLPVWPLIYGQWLIKFMIAIMDTPIIYGFVFFMQRNMQREAAI
ncbi:MAG: queuosine precursor transporter [Candidatus Magnetomorum sp.]|nr:queuosine precursor transporter [Candidatus Magnetomorum sp.]